MRRQRQVWTTVAGRFLTQIALLGWCVFMPWVSWAADPAAQEFARQALAATGVRGGLIVHLGCGDGQVTAVLGEGDGVVVHGLDADAANVDKARALFRSLGIHGKVTAERWTAAALPYADNLVNLLIAENLGAVTQDEVMRVLCPNGVAYVKQGKDWRTLIKPRPAELDEWTHYLHDASNNAVAHDTVVGPPQRLQWLGGPAFARHHEKLASISAVVSAGGRIFYIADEGLPASILFPGRWSLVAHDAFSGVQLWKRPLESWAPHLWGFFDGPPEIARRLVAVGDKVYVTLGYPAPLVALDAATGATVMTYAGTENTEEVLWQDGTLFLVVGDLAAAPPAPVKNRPWAVVRTPEPARGLMAVDAATGNVLWKKPGLNMFAMTLAVTGPRVFYQTPDAVIGLDAKTGAEQWQSPRPSPATRPTWSAPTLVAYGDVVLSEDRNADVVPPPPGSKVHSPTWSLYYTGGPGEMIAFSAATGARLWSCKSYDTHRAPGDLFVIDGLVWVGSSKIRNTEDFTQGLDPMTGEVKRNLSTAAAFTSVHHHRCYRNKATDKFILVARTGTEFIDIQTGAACRNNWARGECQYGIMPCNGLLYLPPHPCACYIQAKLNGFMALAPAVNAAAPPQAEAPRLETGPAAAADLASANTNEQDWPSYRSDPARSGRARTTVPSLDLSPAWRTVIGGHLSSPVMADGRVFVAAVDDHAIHALDAADGKDAWQFTTGGRIDSPPTVSQGRVVFGCRDGWVYCLRATDGALAWRFRAGPGPTERRVVDNDRLESAWPVHGSILVEDGVAYCVAGRSAYLDGGLRLYALDLKSGQLVREQSITGQEDGDKFTPGKDWVHVALIWDGKTATGYIDGRGESVEPSVADGKSTYQGLRIGHQLDKWFFKGPIDNVRIYRRALSLAEVKAIYESERPAAAAPGPARAGGDTLNDGLAVHLTFDEGTGEIAHDRSGNGHDGKVIGAEWVPNGTGHALQFNGTDAWLECGSPADLNFASPITLSVWVRPETMPKGGKDAVMILGSGSAFWNGPYSLSIRNGRFCADINDPQAGKRYMFSWGAMGDSIDMPGGLPDVLSAVGDIVYLRELAFDRQTLAPREDGERHLFGSDGFLHDAWWHRAYWIYGTRFRSGAAGWYLSGREFPAGKILAMDDSSVYGYGMKPDNYRWTAALTYELFAASKDAGSTPIPGREGGAQPGALPRAEFARLWTQDLPIHVRAMALTDGALFIAGPPTAMDEEKVYAQLKPGQPAPQELLDAEAAFLGKKGGSLLSVKPGDGTTAKEYPLDSPPVFDGLIAARGRLYLAAMDGAVVCLGGRDAAHAPGGAAKTRFAEPAAGAK
ncbi:MAG: hypothetical protein A3K19_32075 [Lentisphaerae bacterium RIFOXYB12_FULL_65_16]|nr:MAG: hypothetical protein A3K18_10855 [Lentisphaerae bacterium RIFOXYA12_64_32]OGV88740.1 MAG: hypothetical protein A3K19_32075 [Lentisphaerae bacterium RIFOXYB12_FULL_65_16]